MKPIRFNPQLRLTGCDEWLKAISYKLFYASKRKRRLSRDHFKQFLFCAEVFIANLVLLNNVAADWPLMIRRDKNSLMHGKCFGAQHLAVSNALCKKGWIVDNGIYRFLDDGYQAISSISLTRFPFADIGLEHVIFHPRQQHVLMKSFKDAEGKSVILPWPEQQSDLIEQMVAVNQYLQSLDIEYLHNCRAARFWLDVHPDYKLAIIRSIADNTMLRIFNESLSQGGRLWQGWWLGINHEQRFDLIKLAGERICYVDYNALNLRLAYAIAGADYPQLGDAYIAGNGSRKAWKQLTLAMLMAREPLSQYPGTLPEQAFMRDELGSSAIAACRAIAVKHPALASMWYTGIGARLQCIESDIIIAVLLQCQANGLSVMPVHDCCICPTSQAHKVQAIMQYQAHRVGYSLPTQIEID